MGLCIWGGGGICADSTRSSSKNLGHQIFFIDTVFVTTFFVLTHTQKLTSKILYKLYYNVHTLGVQIKFSNN